MTLAAGALALPWLMGANLPLTVPSGDLLPHEALLVAIMAAGTIGGALARRPIVAALSVGMTGIGLALVFALFGGIDLAITQLLVETLIVVILVAVLSRLPRGTHRPRLSTRIRDLVVASVLGLTATLAVLLSTGTVRSRELTELSCRPGRGPKLRAATS